MLILAAALAAACSKPPEGSDTANTNAGPSQPIVTENGTPQATSDTGSSEAAAPEVQPEAATSTGAGEKDGPKLVVPVKRLEFGKQPQNKELTRTFVVKNNGTKKLKIEAVEPS